MKQKSLVFLCCLVLTNLIVGTSINANLSDFSHINFADYNTKRINPADQSPVEDFIMIAIALVAEAISLIAKYWPAIASFFGSKTTYTPIKEIAGQGFTYFTSAGYAQKGIGVEDAYFSAFQSYLMTQMDVQASQQSDLNGFIEEALFSSDDSTWTAHHIIYNKNSNSGSGEAYYALVMANHNTTTSTTNWIWAQYNASFTLAANILVILKKTSHLEYKSLPAAITLSDVEQVFGFMQYVGTKQIADLLGVPAVLPTIQTSEDTHLAPIERVQEEFLLTGALGYANAYLSLATSIWQLAKEVFAHSVTYSILYDLKVKGFEYFESSGTSQANLDIMPQYLEDFTNVLGSTLNIGQDNQEEFQTFLLETLMVADSNSWAIHHIMHSDAGGSASYAIVMANHNATTNNTNWLISKFSATFQLAPNILVISKTDSKWGGLDVDQTLQYKNLPNGFTIEDAKDILDFFYYVGMKGLASILNIQCQFPSLTSMLVMKEQEKRMQFLAQPEPYM